MKLLSTIFIASVFGKEPEGQEDCPNDAWQFVASDSGNYCEPIGVSVTCDNRVMQVVFTHQHIYKNLDASHIDTADAAAIAGFDSTCSTVSKNGGTYTASVKLDKCNTSVTQTGGKIVFENNFTGNVDALTVQGIIMTKVLAFPVTCTYDESVTLELNPLHLQGSDIDITGISNNGTFGDYFDMIAYHDAEHGQEITSDDAIVIGEPVYVRIFELENIPTNIDYYLTDCTAFKKFDKPSQGSFEIVDQMCYNELVSASNTQPIRGGQRQNSGITFDFTAFAFEGQPDQLSMQCSLKLCALAVDGNTVLPDCAVQADPCPAGFSDQLALSRTIDYPDLLPIE